MSSKMFLRIISIFILLVVSFSLVDEIKIYAVIKENTKIEAEIIEMPSCCDCRNIIASFKCENQSFESEVGYFFCNKHKVGDKFVFYHNNRLLKNFVYKLYKENS